MSKITYTDLHLHSEYSLKDGLIRIADHDDPKAVKAEIILNADRRGTGAVTCTDHGVMYAQAQLALVAKIFKLKHIPGCEFYIAPETSRFDKGMAQGESAYRHLCVWAKNKQGYANMCILQKLSHTEGFYYRPRIDRELLDRYGEGLMLSDACMSGILSGLILEGKDDKAFSELLWYMDRFKDDFYIEVQNHGIEAETMANQVKIGWANMFGLPIIATTDSHYYAKTDADAHRALLSIQYARRFDDPAFTGFSGTGYHLLSEEELLEAFPIEYLNNTQLIVDKVEDNIIEFGEVTPPKFVVSEGWVNG